ncbi:hypothetical protein UlMin_009248 [Ulmus minor]
MDFSNNNKNALKWAIDNLADKGDTLFIIHISHNTINESCTLIPLTKFRQAEIKKKYDVPTDIDVFDNLDTITIASKLYWGDAREKILEAFEDLKLDSFVMGSRGLGTIQRTLTIRTTFIFITKNSKSYQVIIHERDMSKQILKITLCYTLLPR